MVDWHLLPSEVVIYESKLSWKLFWKKYLLALLLVIGGISSLFLDFSYSTFAGASMIVSGLVLRQLTNFKRGKERILLTTERLIIRKVGGGVIHDVDAKSIDMEQIRLSEIVNITVKQKSFLERKLLNMGDVNIKTRDGHAYEIVKIDNPYSVERAIYHLLEKEKERGLIKSTPQLS